jgi:hypothetical protein
MLHSSQIVHQSSVDIYMISKEIEMTLHLTYITKAYSQVCPMWFQGLWYIRHKLCTYLASRLVLSPNRPKWASTWPTSPISTIGCAWKGFHAHGTFGTNRAPSLHRDENYLRMDQNKLPLDPRHVWVPPGVPKMISMLVVHSVQTLHLSCIEINTISKWTETSFHLTHIT